MRVLSYNIHKGMTFGNLRQSLELIKSSIDFTEADVVFLQEVQGHNQRRTKRNSEIAESQFEFLAGEAWPHFAYGRNAVYSTGHHGNSILSRFPILSWSNTNISNNAFESRGFLHAKIHLPPHSTEVHMICVHLDLLERGRMRQVAKLADFVERDLGESPLIIAGDLNDWSGRVSRYLERWLEMREVFRFLKGTYPKTYPAFFPVLSLDRILVRGFEPKDGKVLTQDQWMRQSDHAALLAELELA